MALVVACSSDGAKPVSQSRASNRAPSSAAENAEPTLGTKPFETPFTGFGEVRPTQIFNGGDSTGRFEAVTWQSWGGAQAIGSGTGCWVPPGGAVADCQLSPISLVAYDLTQCGGHLAYRRLATFFPTKGEHFDPATNGETQYDLCAFT